MRKLALGITIGFLAASTLAWAFTVKFPNTLKIRGMAFVDEAGNVLGGITPTTVDVVNMPTSLDVNVTSLPASAGIGEPHSALATLPTCGSGAPIFTVPGDKNFLLRQIVLGGLGSPDLILYDTTGDRLLFNADGGASLPGASLAFAEDIVFTAGETVSVKRFGSTACNFKGTLIGRLVPAL